MKGLRLLVCDDDPEMRSWLVGVLEMEGAVVSTAASGTELLHRLLAPQAAFDLVVSDVRMPPPDGLRALAAARARGCRVPFLLITAFGDLDQHREAEHRGARMLDKPFSAAELIAVIRAITGGPDP